MRFVQKQKQCLISLLLSISVLTPVLAEEEVDSAVFSCLKAWGNSPFGKNPEYKTLPTSVKVFGIGSDTTDTEITPGPALVLVNPGVNVAGGNVIQVLNPNGWYCFRTTVNVIGGLTIKAHCKAHLATTAGDAMGVGQNSEGQGVSVMGSTRVKRVG